MKQLLALFLALTLPLIGADTAWDRLEVVRPGERIWIHYMEDGKLRKSQGTMGAWTADSVAVRLGKRDVVLSQNDVRKVLVYAGKSRGKGAGYGFLVGAGVGAGLGGATAGAGGGEGQVPAVASVGLGALMFGGIGALIGAAVGATKKVPVYDADAAFPGSDIATQMTLPSLQIILNRTSLPLLPSRAELKAFDNRSRSFS